MCIKDVEVEFPKTLTNVVTTISGLSPGDQQTMFHMLQESLKENKQLQQDFINMEQRLNDIIAQNERLERHIVEVKTTIQIQKNVPPQVLLQQPVILHDALGRIAPFHLEFISSAAALRAVLEVRFLNVGHRKVVRHEYGLRDLRKRTAIDTSKPWESILFVGFPFDIAGNDSSKSI